jgi:hypothetical protein
VFVYYQCTVEKRLTANHNSAQNKYDKNRLYQLTCPNCEKRCTGQTGNPFKITFQVPLRDFKYGNKMSKFGHNLLENKHEIVTMKSTMHIIHITNKGKLMDMLERFRIYRETEAKNQINDKLAVQNNPLFETMFYEALIGGLGPIKIVG